MKWIPLLLLLFPFLANAQDVRDSTRALNKIEGLFANDSGQHRQDTIKALENLFQRKRKGIVVRAVIGCGVIMGIILATATASTPHQSTTMSGTNIYQTNPSRSSDPIKYFFIGAGSLIVIKGIAQNSKYGSKKLKALVNDYKSGKPLPGHVKARLKPRDFN
ncbi:hypothetical protein WSM22_26560 [Cytophagales bacterium WSM2-2]|nr:hypothetical protein WSM22_26560 [Cytophagales bacterium WSM2-2]